MAAEERGAVEGRPAGERGRERLRGDVHHAAGGDHGAGGEGDLEVDAVGFGDPPVNLGFRGDLVRRDGRDVVRGDDENVERRDGLFLHLSEDVGLEGEAVGLRLDPQRAGHGGEALERPRCAAGEPFGNRRRISAGSHFFLKRSHAASATAAATPISRGSFHGVPLSGAGSFWGCSLFAVASKPDR